MLKVKNKEPKRRHWRRYGVFIVNFKHISHLVLVFLLLTRTRCEICSKLTIKTPERRHWRRYGAFIVNFKDISHLVPVFLLLTLNM